MIALARMISDSVRRAASLNFGPAVHISNAVNSVLISQSNLRISAAVPIPTA